jgi:hypothetical protein
MRDPRRDDVGLGDKAHRNLEYPAPAPVALRQGLADDGHGDAPGQAAPGRVQRDGRQPEVRAPGPAMARVPGEVLAHAEHHAAAPPQREQREGQRERMRAEEQHAVHLAQDRVEAPQGVQPVAQRGGRPGQARVVGQRREAHACGHAVGGASGRGVQAAHQDEALDPAGEGTGEEDEGLVARDAPRVAAVREVAVDGDPHGGDANPARAARPPAALPPCRRPPAGAAPSARR